MPDGEELDGAAETAEYITDTVVLFGEKYTAPILQQFKERGFKNIIVLGAAPDDSPPDVQFVGPSAFLALAQFNGIQIFVAEYVLKSTFGSYAPVCEEITADAARALCVTINSNLFLGPEQTYAKQLTALAGIDGFELIEKYVQKGAGILAGRELCALSLINNGRPVRTEFGSVLQVQQSAVNTEVISAAKKTDYVALYKYVSVGECASPADEAALPFVEILLAAIDAQKLSSVVVFDIIGCGTEIVQGPTRATMTREQAARLGFY
jgi:hypothetical protein